MLVYIIQQSEPPEQPPCPIPHPYSSVPHLQTSVFPFPRKFFLMKGVSPEHSLEVECPWVRALVTLAHCGLFAWFASSLALVSWELGWSLICLDVLSAYHRV